MANDQHRPIDHAGMEVLAGTECKRLLQDHRVGRVALEAGEPWVLPVVYRLDGNHIAFRSAVGAKLDLAERGDPIAFEIDGWDEEARIGWSVLAEESRMRSPTPTRSPDSTLSTWSSGCRAPIQCSGS